ncbi:acidocalcisomal exopolyphosphatase, putative [Leishmania tarentolae]|uniref:Acidocalcisomal exopolyphosphatase, putative n=1 Tax=Leishmania tarentolae TaxID=5689 RepID=A0A640K8D9_LEITA|nr:acidocalcisomal exopolyphosphatase, putative [Leishmania tarentolae]
MPSVINDYLRRCLKKVAGKVQPLTVVQGNEGGDMDSIVGCIYLAMLFDKHPKFGFENPVPVLNFPHEDFGLRNDVVNLFKELGIDASLLMSVQRGQIAHNFVDIAALNASIVLYDHNKLRESQSYLASRVMGVVDHHFDEQQYLDTAVKLRILRTVGSACTLVTELYRECGENVECPTLLAAPIVLDTVNFEPAQKKATAEDIAAYKWLHEKEAPDSADAEALFAKLSKWKDDVLVLSVPQILRRDYKQFSFKARTKKGVMVTGTSSVPCACKQLEDHFSIDVIVTEAAKYVEQHQLDVLIFAFAGKVDDKHSREVAFCAKPDVMSFFSPFVSESPGGVSFTMITKFKTADGAYEYASYSLSDPSISRKKLVPALSEFLAEGTWSLL